jgi:hypothetical protein
VTADDRHTDRTSADAADADATIQHYEIRVTGRLGPRWSAWFDGLTTEFDATDGTTVISGPVVDQAALHGLLQKLRDVAIPLVSLVQVAPNRETAHPSQTNN